MLVMLLWRKPGQVQYSEMAKGPDYCALVSAGFWPLIRARSKVESSDLRLSAFFSI
jgi:hypothetical protein